MRVSVLVANFALSEGVADSTDFWLGKFFENIAPESFDSNFDLRDSQHGVFDGVLFGSSGMDFEVLDVAGEIEFGVDPVGMSDGINVLG